MRGLTLVLLLFLPLASADVEFSDPAGDVRYEDDTGQTFPAAQRYGGIDILRGWIGMETATTFEVGMELSEVPVSSGIAPGANGRHFARFSLDGITYDVWMTGRGCVANETLVRVLSLSQELLDMGCAPWMQEDMIFRVQVPKALILDSRGLPARAGSVIEDFRLLTHQRLAGPVDEGPSIEARDDAPDFGGAEPQQLLISADQYDQFHLLVPSAVRASNGGPDTFLYTVIVENRGQDDTLLVSHGMLPNGWDARVPARIEAPAGARVAFPVLVTTQSAHAHGSQETFELSMRATQSGVDMATELGIRYLSVPQLAGHHPSLFVHAGAADYTNSVGDQTTNNFWFNTLEDDERQVDHVLQPSQAEGDVQGSIVRWYVPMDPSLLIGMDFDLGGQGRFEVQVAAETPADTAVLDAWLWHCDPTDTSGVRVGTRDCDQGSWFLLANSTRSTGALPIGRSRFVVELLPQEYADLVPYVDGSNIELEVRLRTDNPAHAHLEPTIDPAGARMDLPLLEYKDPLDAAFEERGELALLSTTAFEHQVNPGATTWFPFTLRNDGDASRRVGFDAIGRNADWAAWSPNGPVDVPAGSTLRVAIAVTAPLDAAPGDHAELFAVAQDVDDPTAVAVSKIRATVTDDPLPAETAPETGGAKKATPGVSVVLVAVALADAALRRR